jgi:beta-glucosidase
MNRIVLFFLVCLVNCSIGADPSLWPKIKSEISKDPKVEQKVRQLLSKMSLSEKVGQMIQAEIKHITPSEVQKYGLGSVLNGGGSFPSDNKYASIKDWVALADQFYLASKQSSSGVPLIWGTDAVHGHNNVFGATIFPHNIGLGAANNPDLIREIGKVTAKEVLATGLDWIFAPTVAVVRNDRWGRTYEGYSERPEIVRSYAKEVVYGIQGKGEQALGEQHLIATVKHFVGDGGTVGGVDQGNNILDEKELIRLHAQGYFSGLSAGAQTVMASFNSWKGDKIHGSRYLLTDVLKNRMGFDGFVIGDWNGHGQVQGCTNQACAQAINAGVDMIMVPQDWKAFLTNTIQQVKRGEISEERINDAVTRILRVKLRAGLFDQTRPSLRTFAGDKSLIGHRDHRALARRAVRESLVLLKNKNKVLPLKTQQRVLVAGKAAHDIARQSGGWTLTWQGTGNKNSDFPGATSIYQGIKQNVESGGGQAELSLTGQFKTRPDVAIVVFGETPYAEGQGDRENLYFSQTYPEGLTLLKKFRALNIPTVAVFISGRPMWVNPELNHSDAFVVAWLPGSEGAGVADLLFKSKNKQTLYDFKGRLSFSWPNEASGLPLNNNQLGAKALFSYGYGLSLKDKDVLGDQLSEIPFPNGSLPTPKDRLGVFRGRSLDPFINYVGDHKNWKYALAGDKGKSLGGLVSVRAIDKKIQEDAREITFQGGDSNYYFQTSRKFNLSHFLKNDGVLAFSIRIDQRPDNEANLLVGTGKVNFNHYLNVAKMGVWENITIDLKCFKQRGTDFSQLDMPFSLATFGSMKISLANIELLSKKPKSASVKVVDCR